MTQNLEALEEEDEEEAEDQNGEELDLDAPLQLLTSVTNRLLKGEIPTSQSRLQSLFEHIQSVVGDVVEASFQKVTLALDQLEEANEALQEHGEESEETEAFLKEFELGRDHIEESLEIMQESFFSARNLNDLEEFEEELREAEVQLAEGLARLESAVMKAENPELFGLHSDVSSETLDEALEAFASSLDALNAHLEDGNPEHLEFVLSRLDEARGCVEKALSACQSSRETQENSTSN